MDKQLIYFIHILFVGPLLLYIYYIGNNLSLRNNDLEYIEIFQIIRLLGILVILYHIYQILQYRGLI